MATNGDDMISLPTPPPPRPAARREAIDAALRRFDGVEEPKPVAGPARGSGWATLHRRPVGALVAATLIAVVAIPAIQIVLNDQPEIASEEMAAPAAPPGQPQAPAPAADALDATSENDAAGEPPQPPSGQLAAADESPPLARAAESRKAEAAPPAMFDAPVPVAAAPPPPAPPPPPPPPPAEPEADSAATGDIVVTGSRISRPQLEAASPVTVVASHDEFLGRLRAAFRANDRRAILRLVAFPLRVNFEDGPRTYSSAREVERDYDRIFTPDVRRSALGLTTGDLRTSDDGRLSGNGTLWFGCASRTCASGVRIREVSP